MRKNILLVNPWICDFAAYDLWIFPLGLLKIASAFDNNEVNVDFVNFLDRFENINTQDPKTGRPLKIQDDHSSTAEFGTGHFYKQQISKPKAVTSIYRKFFRYGIPEHIMAEKLEKFKPDIILLTSGMSYWYVGVAQTIGLLRRVCKNIPIILGGTYARLCPEHAKKNMQADYVFAGADIRQIEDIINRFLDVPVHMNHSDDLRPSFEMLSHKKALPLLGSNGCPFSCTYCASGILYPDFKQRAPESLVHEIDFCVKNFNTRDFVFYDDALLVNPEKFIKPLLRAVIERKFDIRFHTPNGLHTCFMDKELATLMYQSGFKTIRLSLESSTEFLKKQSSQKVTNMQVERALQALFESGFTKREISIYTMLGFPQQSERDINNDIDYVSGLGAQINLSSYSLVPQTQEWRYFVNQGIIEEAADPLLLSHTAFPLLFAGFKPEVIRRLRKRAGALNKQA
ncbi:MAG: B12-binding domain-containing radical SAM protein [Candidatus Omnitrophota bacterium]